MRQRGREQGSAEQLARGLGWFSIGLGVAETFWPREVAGLIGVPADRRTVSTIRTMGGRELLAGIAVLARPDRPGPLWNRVAGDAVDLTLLGLAGRNGAGVDRTRLAATIGAVAGVTAADIFCAAKLQSGHVPRTTPALRVAYTTTINRSLEDVYRYWRNFENLPAFMRHLQSVRTLPNGRSRWRASTPVGLRVEWEAEIVRETENEIIEWRALEGGPVRHRGVIRFAPAPGARGTEVRIEMDYQVPGGAVGRTVAGWLSKLPEEQLREDLRRFKQVMETGEVTLSDGPGLTRPAQPASREAIHILAGVGVRK